MKAAVVLPQGGTRVIGAAGPHPVAGTRLACAAGSRFRHHRKPVARSGHGAEDDRFVGEDALRSTAAIRNAYGLASSPTPRRLSTLSWSTGYAAARDTINALVKRKAAVISLCWLFSPCCAL
jgi:hypothetical protein